MKKEECRNDPSQKVIQAIIALNFLHWNTWNVNNYHHTPRALCEFLLLSNQHGQILVLGVIFHFYNNGQWIAVTLPLTSSNISFYCCAGWIKTYHNTQYHTKTQSTKNRPGHCKNMAAPSYLWEHVRGRQRITHQAPHHPSLSLFNWNESETICHGN